MLPHEITHPAAYHAGNAYFYEWGATHSPSYFGGPSPVKFTGVKHGPRSLHHILTLNGQHIGLDEPNFSELPLFYGLCYDGCVMSYELESRSACRLLELKPTESASDWPYEHYPQLLPHAPLRLSKRTPCSPEQFSACLLHPTEINPQEATIVVPPVFDLGISLWGPAGDAGGVQIIFRVNPATRTVHVHNACA